MGRTIWIFHTASSAILWILWKQKGECILYSSIWKIYSLPYPFVLSICRSIISGFMSKMVKSIIWIGNDLPLVLISGAVIMSFQKVVHKRKLPYWYSTAPIPVSQRIHPVSWMLFSCLASAPVSGYQNSHTWENVTLAGATKNGVPLHRRLPWPK